MLLRLLKRMPTEISNGLHIFSNKLIVQTKSRPLTASKSVLSTGKPEDVFGTLSNDGKFLNAINQVPEEADDKVEIDFLNGKERKTRLRTKQYAEMMKQLAKEYKVTEALDILEERMIKIEKAQPDSYIYNILITMCAKVGYTKKAFQLYNQMKKRGLKVTGATYTSLFNACANSPFNSDGLKRANHLRQLMIEKAYAPNQSNYHAMIKAYARCGDASTAFSLVDEMLSNGILISSETFNFLLQSCASDKEAGFRYALLVWRKMREKNIQPSIYTYNLFLRCIRDCGVGKKDILVNYIKSINDSNQEKVKEIQGISVELEESFQEEGVTRVKEMKFELAPNLIADIPHFGSVTKVGNIAKSAHRLFLVGGTDGFLQQMLLDNVIPNIKTVTVLLEIISSTLSEEQFLLDVITKHKISVDIDFCNMLIKKRNLRNKATEAKEVLHLIHILGLKPDIITFGVLALSCRSRDESKQLLIDLESAGYRPNIEIIGSLLRSACLTWDIYMIFQLLQIIETEKLKVNQKFLDHLENFHKRVEEELRIKEEGGKPHKRVKDEYFLKGYKKLCYFCQEWRKKITVETTNTIHFYNQFKKTKK